MTQGIIDKEAESNNNEEDSRNKKYKTEKR
jgi:hypothetical protein